MHLYRSKTDKYDWVLAQRLSPPVARRDIVNDRDLAGYLCLFLMPGRRQDDILIRWWGKEDFEEGYELYGEN